MHVRAKPLFLSLSLTKLFSRACFEGSAFACVEIPPAREEPRPLGWGVSLASSANHLPAPEPRGRALRRRWFVVVPFRAAPSVSPATPRKSPAPTLSIMRMKFHGNNDLYLSRGQVTRWGSKTSGRCTDACQTDAGLDAQMWHNSVSELPARVRKNAEWANAQTRE